jgi:hypothetical protein
MPVHPLEFNLSEDRIKGFRSTGAHRLEWIVCCLHLIPSPTKQQGKKGANGGFVINDQNSGHRRWCFTVLLYDSGVYTLKVHRKDGGILGLKCGEY